ncbi:MAG: biopolymer transporter ExbD [Pseudomonadota bacterium]
MRIRRSQDAVRVLNITPLIDVVFILLVFFMLATNFASYRLIRVETPRETEVVKTSEGAIVIGIDADGGLTFDTQPIAEDELDAAVAEVIAIDPGRVFLVRPEKGVPLQEAIRLYDAARRAGAQAVSFSGPEGDGEGAR